MKTLTHLKHFIFVLLLSALGIRLNAQYVTIPDATFVNWLQSNGYAACMNGNQLDTTCGAILSMTVMNCYAVPIRDLTGIQYFKNLDTLDCSNDSLYNIPALPPKLQYLNCQFNNLNSLPPLPATLKYLECYNNSLLSLPYLPDSLKSIDCSSNQLSSLPNSPALLQYLWCDWNKLNSLPNFNDSLLQVLCQHNQLTTLPTFDKALQYIDCSANQLNSLPILNDSLQSLICDDNLLTSLSALNQALSVLWCFNNRLDSLPNLPAGLTVLLCGANNLNRLPSLPASLITLACGSNQIDSLPVLPVALNMLVCSANPINSLPTLPKALHYLSCENDSIDSLPTLNDSLNELICSYNKLGTVPSLPQSLSHLDCSHNLINSLPPLPDSLYYFDCSWNPNLTCLPELKRIVTFIFGCPNLNCLPDYGRIDNSVPSLTLFPICGIFNSNGCKVLGKINGQCFFSPYNSCSFNSVSLGTNYVKTQLYSGGNLIQQTFTGGEGFYSFDSGAYANYTVQVDTTNLPFIVSCPDTGYYSITLSAIDTLSYNNNFAFKCRTQGFDIGVQSTLNNYVTPRPNATFALNTVAGDLSELYGARCATGISGQVQITFSGPVTYGGTRPWSLNPTSVNGGTITWAIPDFGAVNVFSAFDLLFKVDSLAIPGTAICFTVTVTPTTGDYNPSNNTLSYCFPVVNALDPNEKEVYPSGNTDTSNHWLTYTVRFQNTGTAPAQNIRVTDTVDSHLDPASFQLLAYSHKNLTQIFGTAVVFNFPNINLPDSATSDSASRGFVQYKIKLKDNLPLGTQIQNTADIYFDLNPAVVTNTTTNTITLPTGINPIAEELTMQLYPNPSKNYVMVETGQSAIGAMLQVTDMTGREALKLQIQNSTFRIPTSAFAQGVYFVKLSTSAGETAIRKLVIER